MPSAPATEHLERLRDVAAETPGVELLLLFGSRTTGKAHELSDWDVGYLGDDVDPGALHSALTAVLGTDAVDVVDLARAGALLRFNAADTGVVLFEDRRGRHERFWLEAVHFWCDAGPMIRAAYDDVLAGLG